MEKLQRFSIRKLSIGAVSCLIGTVSFLSYSYKVQAAETPQTVEAAKAENEIQLEKAQESKPNEKAEGGTQSAVVDKNTVGSQKAGAVTAANEASPKENTPAANEAKQNIADLAISTKMKLQAIRLAKPVAVNKTNASSKPVQMVSLEQSADTTDVQPASDQVESAAANSNAPENNGHAASASTALPKQPANADTQSTMATSGVQPFMNLAVVSDNNDLTPKRETVDSTLTLHYVNQADHKQELKDPTVITMQYTRTNTPQSDGTTEYGDWSYVPGSFKQTGTPITVKDSNNPVKQDNVDKNGENFDVFTITAMYPTVAGYGFYNGINGTRLRDNLRNNERQADAMSKDFYAEYDVAKPTQETVGSQWRIHYIDSTNHEHELKAPTVINMQYVRTNTPQSDGTIQHGDWSYVPGSFKLTGTPITVNDSDNPVKEDNVDKDGKNEDVFIIDAMYPSITGYNFHDGINNARLHDYLLNYDPNGNIQMPTMGQDFYVEYDPISERSVAVKFVDDQSYDFNTSDHKKQVGQAITLTGHDGDTVNLNLTVPDKYQLADGQQLPTTYTFTKGSGDLKIHLVHKVVQREATIDVKLGLMTFVDFGSNDYEPAVITQARWAQLKEEAKDGDGPVSPDGVIQFTEVGTLTGHVGYDLVDEEAVSFGDDWTSLNLDGRTYQMPNGTDVVNGILIDSDDTMGKKLKEYYLNEYHNWDSNKHVDPDYANRPWHGYLSVNATNNTQTLGAEDVIRSGMQAGLAGNESNILAKATGDRAATAVEMANKTIDVNWLQDNLYFRARDFSEHNGQLQAKTGWEAFGVYIPYVEKTATRTIKVTAPDGKTTTVKQTATLAKQVDFGKDAHPAWTTGEWASYVVPTIPGYTASQSNVAKETVTGTTEDQTVNITYTANPQTSTVVYQTEDGTSVHTTTVNGHTGQTVKVSNEVPVGWHVVNGTVPSEITFGPNGTPKTVVTIAHSHATVTPDAPKTTGDKLPDNSGKNYPAGVGESDLNKTVTRTIKVTTPDGQNKTIAQTAKLTRTADVDEVTGEVTYSDWTTGYWSDYTAPSVSGYTANYPYIAGQLVTGETTDQTIEITYTANDGTQTIVYQDKDGSEVGKQVVPGKTDETVKVTPDVPDGYVVKGEIPTKVTIKPDDTPITVTVEHGKSHVTPDKPVNKGDLIPDTKDKHYPEGLTHNDLNKTVTREITIIDPTGKKTTTTQTVTFTRGATVDEVTNKVTYDDWSENGKHAFDKVDVPNVPGYTASGEVPEVVVTPETQSSKVDITYTANAQHMMITYVDDTTGKKLHTDKLDGVSDQDTKYTTVDSIKQYTDLHYKLVSDSTNGKDLIFDHDDNADQSYEVHFVHGTHTINQTTSSKQTIHYVYADDLARHGKAADDNVQQLSFKRDGYHDEVTDVDHWNAWTPANSNYSAVDSPVIQGYTPDKLVVEKSTVNPTDKDTEITVVYNADKQHMTITYIDDTTGETLRTDNPTGVSDQDAKYTTSDTIKKYEDQHYKLVSDSTKGQDLIFDHNDDADQTYEVHFVHGSHTINQITSPKQTIHYVYADDLARHGKAADDNVQQLSFKRDGYNDEVTGTDHWNAWTPVNSQYQAVDSPVIQGYTPDKLVVEKSTVNPIDKDTEITVVYNGDKQAARVIYVDKTTNATLTSNNLSGKSDKDSGYNTKDTIEKYQSQHYVLTGDETDGKNVIFDHDDQQDQTYYVYFVHGTQKVNRQDTVTSTIDYKFEDGKTAQPAVTQTKQFIEDGVKDLVTGKITWDKAEPQKFDDVTTPTISGYTPNRDKVAGNIVNFGDNDITNTVTYTPNKQKAKVVFIDDTDKKILDTHDLIGVTNGHEKYDPSKEIDEFVHKHYVLVPSDDPEKDYPEKGFTYDNNDDEDQVFEVHFKHGSHDISEKKSITETITYTMSDGSKAPNKVEKQVEFDRVGKHDDVTNIDIWNKWQPNKQSFSAVLTPDVKGYTPDIKLVEAKTVTSGDKDITITITYTPDKQKAKVVFIDDTTKKILDTHDLIGVTNGHEKYNPSEEIKKFIHDSYVFVSSDYPEKGFTYDNDDGQDQVFEVHLKEIPTESDTPTILGNTEDNGGSNDTPTNSDESEKDNGGSDTVDKSGHKTPVKRNSNKKHHGTKNINNQKNANKKHRGTKTTNKQKNAKTTKLNPNKVNAKANKLTQTKLGKIQESTNDTLTQTGDTNDVLPQTGNKQSGLMAALGLAISSLGMIGAVKSKKRKDN